MRRGLNSLDCDDSARSRSPNAARHRQGFSDPARYSFALGGKDAHPFPVPLKTYDETIDVLRRSLDGARVGDREKVDGLRRLNEFVRQVHNRMQPVVDFQAAIAHERAISPALGGRSVMDHKKSTRRGVQLRLF